MPKPPDIDFPTSGPWQKFYAESGKPPEFKKKQPKTIRVAGMTLHNIDPNASIDDTTGPKLAENLRKLGLQPPPSAPVKQADFLHLVPVSKGYEPKKIHPAWPNDPESFMEIGSDVHKRRRAQGSDAGHDKTVWSQKRRKNLGLPEKALPFKDRLMAINALTPEDLSIIKEKLGFNPERIPQYAPLTQELILHKLHAYKDWVRNQPVKV